MYIFWVYPPAADLAQQATCTFFHTRFLNPYLHFDDAKHQSRPIHQISDKVSNCGFAAALALSSPGVQICFRYLCKI